MRFNSFLFIVLSLVLMGNPTPGKALEISPKMLQEDSRLLAPVTYESEKIFLAELFRDLSKQTNISLDTETFDDASGTILTVSFSRKPLIQVLNAIWSAVSYRSSDWEWEREGKQGDYHYRLVQPRTHKYTSDDLQQVAQREFERQMQLLFSSTRMSPEEKNALKKAEPKLAPSLENPTKMQGLSLLTECFDAPALLEMLRGNKDLQLKFDSFPDSAKQFVREMQKQEGDKGSPPGSITAKTRKNPGGSAPTLFISLEHLGGFSYGGGPRLERDLRGERLKDWMLAGDNASSKAQKNPIVPVKEGEPGSEKLPANATNDQRVTANRKLRKNLVGRRLLRLAKAGNLSVVMVAEIEQQSIEDPREGSVGDYVHGLEEPMLWWMTKWRGDILLISPWRLQPEARTPFKIIEELRQARLQNNGMMPFSVLMKMDKQLTDPQKMRLSADFPGLNSLVTMRGFLDLYLKYPEMKRIDGMALNAEVSEFLQSQPDYEFTKYRSIK